MTRIKGKCFDFTTFFWETRIWHFEKCMPKKLCACAYIFTSGFWCTSISRLRVQQVNVITACQIASKRGCSLSLSQCSRDSKALFLQVDTVVPFKKPWQLISLFLVSFTSPPLSIFYLLHKYIRLPLSVYAPWFIPSINDCEGKRSPERNTHQRGLK